MKSCKNCQSSFEVLEEDRKFYQKMEVPEPTLCYLCRMQRRLANRNERFLYHRQCNLTGKPIISSFSVNKAFPVFNNDAWWGDDWDALDYGRDFDFSRPFFEQFFELRDQVPRMALQQQRPLINSDYCNCVSKNKNCYLLFSTNYCEDCYYGSWVNYSKNCIDNAYINYCELCYECVGCLNCYALQYSKDCTNCKDSYFLRNCQGCSDCFGCSNLVNKQYYFFNQPKSKSEYEHLLSQIDLGSYQTIKKIKQNIDQELADLVVKAFTGANNQNSLGDYLNQTKNCFYSFEVDEGEDLRYCQCLKSAKSCMDYSYWGQAAEQVYESQACGYNIFNIRFCNLCWDGCSNLTYSDHLFSCQNCFGCVGLKKQKYCILNKQYKAQEFENLKTKIIEHMKKTGEWGEFFPISQACYAYNETLAQEQIPLSKEVILANNWSYQEIDADKKDHQPFYEIPNHIRQAENDVTNQILLSEQSGKSYKVISQELDFYRENNIPIPRLTPDERHWARLNKRNRRVLYNRHCANCPADIRTTYSPDRPEKVLCENCYLKTVY